MLTEIYRGQRSYCSPGDVVFAVFKPNTNYIKPLPFEHAAILFGPKTVTIAGPTDSVEVLEVTKHATGGKWPNDEFEVHLSGEKRTTEDCRLTSEDRFRIVDTAERIVRRSEKLIDHHRNDKHCEWEMRRYKFVHPNSNDPDVADELHFTCAGFVEYCYERAEHDLINDQPPCFRNHTTRQCSVNSVPLYYNSDKNEYIHRLFPGYLIHAFIENLYPLDFDELRQRGVDPRDFQRYS